MSGASRHFIFATLHAKASSNNDQLHLQYILISTHSNCVCIVVIDFVNICDGPFAVKLIINNKKGIFAKNLFGKHALAANVLDRPCV